VLGRVCRLVMARSPPGGLLVVPRHRWGRRVDGRWFGDQRCSLFPTRTCSRSDPCHSGVIGWIQSDCDYLKQEPLDLIQGSSLHTDLIMGRGSNRGHRTWIGLPG
jgi:hypothetical protein